VNPECLVGSERWDVGGILWKGYEEEATSPPQKNFFLLEMACFGAF